MLTHPLEHPGKVPIELIEVQFDSYPGGGDILRFDDVYGGASQIAMRLTLEQAAIARTMERRVCTRSVVALEMCSTQNVQAAGNRMPP